MAFNVLVFLALLGCGLLPTVAAENLMSPRRALLETKEKSECPLMYAPYVCSIRNVDGNHNCGGVVISEDAVLTSAGCVDRRIKSNAAPNPTIFIGGRTIDQPVQRRMAERVFIHENWDGNQLHGYDIAIIKLDKPTCVQPVKFIGKRDPKIEEFTVFGYGRRGSSGDYSTELEGGQLKYMSRADCNAKFDLPIKLGRDAVCFKTAEGIAAVCAGDEGGPIAYAPLSPVYQDSLIAISSYTIGRCDDTNSISVAMNISKFRGWISGILKSEAFRKKTTVVKKKSTKSVNKKQKRSRK